LQLRVGCGCESASKRASAAAWECETRRLALRAEPVFIADTKHEFANCGRWMGARRNFASNTMCLESLRIGCTPFQLQKAAKALRVCFECVQCSGWCQDAPWRFAFAARPDLPPCAPHFQFIRAHAAALPPRARIRLCLLNKFDANLICRVKYTQRWRWQRRLPDRDVSK
jgi:hypothetical protein